MSYVLNRNKKRLSFREAWADGLTSGVVEVTKLRQKHSTPPALKEHTPVKREEN